MIWENLGETKATKMVNELMTQGMTEDDAFTEVYSIECNMDACDDKE